MGARGIALRPTRQSAGPVRKGGVGYFYVRWHVTTTVSGNVIKAHYYVNGNQFPLSLATLSRHSNWYWNAASSRFDRSSNL